MADCTLYVEPDFSKALEIGMDAFRYGTENGFLDRCTIDAVMELGQHVNGLLRSAGVDPQALPAIEDPPRSADHAFALLGLRCYFAKSSAQAESKQLLSWLWQILQWIFGQIFGGLQPTAA